MEIHIHVIRIGEIIMNERDKNFILKCRNDIVFFIEHLLYDEEGQHYKVEPHQKAMMQSKEGQVAYFCGRRLGKSFMLAAEALHRSIFFKYQRIYILSPTEEQATELADVVSGLIERSTVIEREVKKDNVMTKRFYNGSRIKIRTAGGRGNVSSMIGSGAHLLIIDEIQDVSQELINKIIPIQRGQKGKSKFIVSGTPRDRSGFLFQILENASKIWDDGEWKEIPNKTGTFTVYRQQTCYLDDNDNIIRSSTPRITIEELKEDWENMPTIQFKQEYCLDFIATVSDVYSEELREQILYDQEYITFGSNKPVVAGLDIGKMRNETVLYIAEVIPDPKPNNKTYKRLDLKWHKTFPLGTKYSEIENYVIYELTTLFPKIFRIVVDATGVGEAIWETIHTTIVKEQKKKIEVKSFKFSKEKKKDLVESCLAAMERGQVSIPWNKRLNSEMAGYKREITDSKNYIYQKNAGSDDYVDAMNLCIYNISLGLVCSIPIDLKAVPKTIPRTYKGVRSVEIMKSKKELPRHGEYTKQVNRRFLNSNRRRL